jgi:hypothetical protein
MAIEFKTVERIIRPFCDDMTPFQDMIIERFVTIVDIGLTESNMKLLHQSMYHDYDGMAGIYRTLPAVV